MLDLSELVKRAVKYLIEGFMIAVAAYAIPKRKLDVEEIVVITLMATATFAILDVFIPVVGARARDGAGLGIGVKLVGGL